MDFGLQTFTIRKAQRKDMESAYLPIVKMGISALELARIDFSQENAFKIKELSDRYGSHPVSIQVKPKYVFADVDGITSFCHTVGCKNAVISMLPFECILGGEDKFYSFVDALDKQSEIYAANGITLAYHHHNWEYIKLSSGKSRFAELLSRTERIKIVNDTYWTARCGVDPARQIRELGDRLLGIHLRDLAFKAKGLDVKPHDTAIGRGVIDFRSVLEAAEEVGCEYAVIEQKTKTPYDDIRFSYESIQQLLRDKE